MNKEYIERESLIEDCNAIISNIQFTSPYQDDIDTMVSGMERIRDMIDEAPAADVAPVVHGEWIHKNGEMYCSICNSEALMDEVYYESPYCPDCGARMDGGNSNE